MFKRTLPISDPVRIHFEGNEITAERGDSVAAALLAAGVNVFRESAISGEGRAPLCMIGNCFDCLLEIDGEPNRQACQLRVRNGMQVRVQRGKREAGVIDEP